MPLWSVQGAFLARRNDWQPFTKTCTAPTADAARERVLSQIGGSHGLRRGLIRIDAITEARP